MSSLYYAADEHQGLLSDYNRYSNNSPSPSPNVLRFKYSNTSPELFNLCQYRAPVHKKVASCSDLPSSSNNCFINTLFKVTDETVPLKQQHQHNDNCLADQKNHFVSSTTSIDASSQFHWHPDYLIPPKIDHPLHRSLFRYFGKSCLLHALGLAIGVVMSLLFCCLFLIIVPFKLLYFVVTRCTYREAASWAFLKIRCDPMWPWGLFSDKSDNLRVCSSSTCDNSLHVLTLQGHSETGHLMQCVWRKLFRHLNIEIDDQRGTNSDDDIRHYIKMMWSRDEKLRLKTLDDLETFLTDLYMEPFSAENKLKLQIYIITEFGDSECTLIVLKQKNATAISCPLRLLCVFNDSKLFFTSSPHIQKEAFASQLCVKITVYFWHFFTILSLGPLELFWKMRRPESPIWAHAKNVCGKKQRKTTTANKSGDLPSYALTWSRLPNTDLLAHAEKVLRVNTQEILTSFVAGALRRHFRANGLRHPPAVRIDVPLAVQEMPYTIGAEQQCNFTLLPVSLAVDIDGAVPRAWETQRRLYEAVESSFWRTANFVTSLCDAALPERMAQKLFSSAHTSCDGFVCFWRAVNEMTILNRRVFSVLAYPPMAKSNVYSTTARGKFGFSFVQTGRDIMLSLLVDVDHFADVNVLLKYFQTEFAHLLKHLTSKMTTLTQISIFPQTDDDSDGSGTTGEVDGVSGGQLDAAVIITQEEPAAVEDLELLLLTVQNELEQMKRNPVDGRQADYLLKLTRLETKMEAFHEEIIDKLKSVNPSKTPYEKQLGETTWYDLLRLFSAGNPSRRQSAEVASGSQDGSSNEFEILAQPKHSQRMSTPNIGLPKHRLHVTYEWP